MKKVTSILLVFVLIVLTGCNKNKKENMKEKINKNTVTYNGTLKVDGTKLVNEKNEQIQLRGISTHGIQWFGDIYNIDVIKNLKDTWGINVFRLAMYTDPNSDGYIKNNYLKDNVIKLVDEVISLDMYVIIDWHILSDGNPTTYEKESIEFFDEISKKYKDVPNVIFEICNEPNGKVKWDNDVLPYAEKVIEVIRKNSPNALIIVGIPDWCRELTPVSKNPLEFNNIMYAVHFYAGSNGQELRNKMDDFLNAGLPIFVSECGITDSTGDGTIYKDKFKEWINYLNDKNISWLFWSLSNKNESSSLLREDYQPAKYTFEYKKFSLPKLTLTSDLNNYLSETGLTLKEIFDSYK